MNREHGAETSSFWSYHLSKQGIVSEEDSDKQHAFKVLLCGGLAGVITWASIFPLDVVKTRVQTWDQVVRPHRPLASHPEVQPLISSQPTTAKQGIIADRPSTYHIARAIYRTEGISPFFRGLGICSARAFVVNAVQWAVSILLHSCDSPETQSLSAGAGIRVDDESASTVDVAT